MNHDDAFLWTFIKTSWLALEKTNYKLTYQSNPSITLSGLPSKNLITSEKPTTLLVKRSRNCNSDRSNVALSLLQRFDFRIVQESSTCFWTKSVPYLSEVSLCLHKLILLSRLRTIMYIQYARFYD